MNTAKKFYILSGISLIVFIIFTLMLMNIDVAAIGPEGSSVGFSSLNGAVASKLTYNSAFYYISEIFGYWGIATAGIFGLFGIMQLIHKKSLFKVDLDIIFLGVFYVAMLATYILFDKVVINYRPVILDEGLEPSYPSSHTMLAIGFLIVAICQFNSRLKKLKTRRIVIGLCLFIMIGIISTRTLSGVHWITDIIGAIFLASFWALLYCGIFYTLLSKKKEKNKKKL